jgi:hypothetical protein
MDSRTFYGPHDCFSCGRKICKASNQEGGESFDYPEGPIYPNTQWNRHNCIPQAVKPPLPRKSGNTREPEWSSVSVTHGGGGVWANTIHLIHPLDFAELISAWPRIIPNVFVDWKGRERYIDFNGTKYRRTTDVERTPSQHTIF